MKTSECTQLFELHYKLLAIYEPAPAVLWLVSKQALLDERAPCEVLGDKGGFARVLRVIAQATDSAHL